jgi:hypothetical protein
MRKIQRSPLAVVEGSLVCANCIRLGEFPVEVYQQSLAIGILGYAGTGYVDEKDNG